MRCTRLLRLGLLLSLSVSCFAPPAVRAGDAEVTAGPKGFSLRSSEGDYELKLRGIVHADYRTGLDDEKGRVLDTFLLRRARLLVEGKTAGIYSFRLMPEWSEGRPQLLDFYADIRPREAIGVRVGKFKSPVGLERLQSAQDLTFIERAYPTSLVPNRDVGILVVGSFRGGTLEYSGGFVNGSADGASSDTDATDAKDVVGRVFTRPFAKSEAARTGDLGLGVGVSFGDQAGTPSVYRSPGQATILSYADKVVLDESRTRISPQGYYYRGPFALLAEYATVQQHIKKDAVRTEVKTNAWQVAASVALTGESESFRSINPKHPVDAKGGSGAVELAARYTVLETDDAAFDDGLLDRAKSVEEAKTVTVGVNWHLQKSVKFQVDLESTSFTGGAADGKDRTDERALLSRLQFAY